MDSQIADPEKSLEQERIQGKCFIVTCKVPQVLFLEKLWEDMFQQIKRPRRAPGNGFTHGKVQRVSGKLVDKCRMPEHINPEWPGQGM